MYIEVDIDEDVVLSELSDKKLIREIESRDYQIVDDDNMIIEENSSFRKKILNIKKVLNMRDVSSIDDIIDELNIYKTLL